MARAEMLVQHVEGRATADRRSADAWRLGMRELHLATGRLYDLRLVRVDDSRR